MKRLRTFRVVAAMSRWIGAASLAVGLCLPAVAQDMPTTYVLRGMASGNLGGLAFAQEPFTLAFEGLAENLTSGTVPYVVNGNPRWDWFSQDFLSRIIFNLPSAQIFTGVLNPAAYQLLT